MAVATKLLTIEDFEGLDDPGVRYELLRGKLIESALPTLEHGYHVSRVLTSVGTFVELHRLGLVGCNGAFELRRAPESLLIPDVAFVRSDRIPAVDADWNVYLSAPDAVFEVVGSSDSAWDFHDKTEEYLDSGVRAVVAVWPRSRSVSVHRPGGNVLEYGMGDVLELDDVLPGFRLPIADNFRRPDIATDE